MSWDSLLAALRVEPREGKAIIGASGIEHQVLGIGVDDKTRRLTVISAEHDARASALVQADVQATVPDAKVLVIRPVAIDLNAISRSVLRSFGTTNFSLDTFMDRSQEEVNDFVKKKNDTNS